MIRTANFDRKGPPPITSQRLLKPIGRAYSAGDDYSLPRIGAPPDVIWSTRLAPLLSQIQQRFKADLVSVLLRGSVARGTAVDGVSDLDLVVVVCNPNQRDLKLALPGSPKLKIEAPQVNPDGLLGPDAHKRWLPFNLSFSGWTLYGRDIIAELPPPSLGRHAIAHLPRADRWLSSWEKEFLECSNEARQKMICAWLMKRIVRSLFEAVMIKRRVYTRDIYPCAEIACSDYQEYAEHIWRAAELAVFPTAQLSEIKTATHDLAPLLRSLAAEQNRLA